MGLRQPESVQARWLVFNIVGAGGLVVQLASLWALRSGLGLHYLVAAPVAIGLAIAHNFLWHARWTWADRPASRWELVRRLARFSMTNGAISILGNLALMAALVELTGMHYLLANLLSVAACSLANFALATLVVFDARSTGTLALAISFGSVAAGARPEAADLHANTTAAFERYVRLTEARIEEELRGTRPFLWVDGLPEPERQRAYSKLGRGEIVVSRLETRDAGRFVEFPDAMRHHWVGTVFAGGVRLDRAVTVMQAYDRYQDVYRPSVRRSRILSRAGNRFKVYLQLFMKKVIGVVLNTEYDVEYVQIAPARMYVRSYSTRIAEVRLSGTPEEYEEPVGHDTGFLWRFNNYCALEERNGGTYIQCESVSLSRDIPVGIGWLIGPFVTSIPRESLELTLGTMRAALQN